ncbi:amidohydrolase, partial [Sphingobacterium shayense]|nr:amidohydrolase [Sphingobacterium shayense]
DMPIWMAAEDFAYYTQKYPAAFFLVGTKNEEKGILSELHTPTFDIDESIFKGSIPLMVNATLSLLNTH